MPRAGRCSTRRGEAAIQDFKPTLKLPDGIDVSRIDPALETRSAGAAAEPAARRRRAQPVRIRRAAQTENAHAGGGASEAHHAAAIARRLAAPGHSAEAGDPADPAQVLRVRERFRGVAPGAAKRAFFLDGEDIVVAGENDVIRNRFKIIRIGVNSAVVEDTTNKNQQTLPLVEELPG